MRDDYPVKPTPPEEFFYDHHPLKIPMVEHDCGEKGFTLEELAWEVEEARKEGCNVIQIFFHEADRSGFSSDEGSYLYVVKPIRNKNFEEEKRRYLYDLRVYEEGMKRVKPLYSPTKDDLERQEWERLNQKYGGTKSLLP